MRIQCYSFDGQAFGKQTLRVSSLFASTIISIRLRIIYVYACTIPYGTVLHRTVPVKVLCTILLYVILTHYTYRIVVRYKQQYNIVRYRNHTVRYRYRYGTIFVRYGTVRYNTSKRKSQEKCTVCEISSTWSMPQSCVPWLCFKILVRVKNNSQIARKIAPRSI